MIPLVDPAAVAAAHQLGLVSELPAEMQRLPLRVGGQLDPGRFTPYNLPPAATSVAALFSAAPFLYENGTAGHAGRAAVLRVRTSGGGAVDLLLVEQSAYFVGQLCFKAFGCAPMDYGAPPHAPPHCSCRDVGILCTFGARVSAV